MHAGAAPAASTATAPHRCRAVVVGSSVGCFIRPLRGSLHDQTYAAGLEALLQRAGVPAQVVNSSRWTMLLPEVLRRLEDLVLGHEPDVVIVNLGLVDAQPRTVPLRWFRWMFGRAPVQSVGRRAWRRLWGPVLARWYRRVGPYVARLRIVPPRVPAGQFERDLRVLIDTVRHERSALVVLIGITPPGPKVEAALPGTTARCSRYDRVLRAAADGPDVHYVDVGDLGLELDELAPDGIHFSPEGHRAVAGALAEAVLPWWRDAERCGLEPLAVRSVG